MTARARKTLGGWIVSAIVLTTVVALGCRDQAPPTTGALAVNLVSAPPSLSRQGAAPGSPEASASAAMFTSVRGTATSSDGETTRNATVTDSGDVWILQFTDLPPGSYSIVVEGLEGTDLTYFGQGSGSVVAGETRTANVPWNSARPTMRSPTTPTTALRFPVTFDAVSGATEYRVQWGLDGASAGARETTVTASPAMVSVNALGTYGVRGFATIGTRTSGASDPVTVEVVSDQDPTGASAGDAAPLGFGSGINQTLSALNIVPASDEDWFGFQGCGMDTLRVETRAARLSPPSSLNTRLRLYTGDGATELASDDDGTGGTDSRIEHVLPADGPYGIQVTGVGGTVGHYQLVLSFASGPNVSGTSCQVPIDTIIVSPPTATLRALTATQALGAAAVDADGDTLTDVTSFTWSSSDELVATVDAAGIVTAVGPGTATITADPPAGAPPADSVAPEVDARTGSGRVPQRERPGGRTEPDTDVPADSGDARPALAAIASGSAEITVVQAPATIVVTPDPDTITFITGTAQLNAEVRDSLGSALAGAGVTWASTDTNVVQIDASGLVTAVNAGETTVTAAFDTVQVAATVRVVQSVNDMVLSAGNDQIGFADFPLAIPLAVEVEDAAGFPIAGATVNWAVTAGGGSVADPTSVTDANGIARVDWTLGSAAGDQMAEATLDTLTVPFAARAVVGTRWVNAAGGDWHVAGNWSTNAVPTADDTVLIALSGDYVVIVSGDAEAGRLTIGAGPDSSGSQYLDLQATLTVSSQLALVSRGGVNTRSSTINADSVVLADGAQFLFEDGATVNAQAILSRGVLYTTGDVTLDAVSFNSAGSLIVEDTATVAFTTGAFVFAAEGSLLFDPGTTLDFTGTSATFQGGVAIDTAVVVQTITDIAVTGDLTTHPQGTIEITGATVVADSIDNQGTIFLDAATLNGRLHNTGYLSAFAGASHVSGPISTTGTSAIEVDGIGTQLFTQAFTNEGTVTLTGSAGPPGDVQLDMAGTGTFVNNGTVDLVTVPSTIFVDAFTNNGNVAADGGICCPTVAGAFTNTPGGYVAIHEGGLNAEEFVNEGLLEFVSPDDTVRVFGGNLDNTSTGTITGSGTIDAGGELVSNDGLLEPGPPGGYGRLRILGDLEFGPNSVLRFDLMGMDPGVDMDRLDVMGEVHLDGALDVTDYPGFDLSYGAFYEVMTYGGSRFNTWADTTGLNLYNEHRLNPQWTPTTFRLRVAPPFVVLAPGADTLTLLGDTLHWHAEARAFSDDPIPAVTNFFWVLLDTTVARVGPANGIVQAKAPGSTTLLAFSAGGTGGSAEVTVEAAPVASISIDQPGLVITAGGSAALTAEVRDGNDAVVDFPVSWSTRNPVVATAASDGTITAWDPGQTAVRAGADTVEAWAAIQVLDPALPVAGLWDLDSVTTEPLTEVWAANPEQAWGVGLNGTVVHWDGSSLSTMDIGAGALEFKDVHGLGPHDVYVAAWTGEVFRYDGASWTQLPSPPEGGITSMFVSTPRSVWFTLFSGHMMRWNGDVWDVFDFGNATELTEVWGSDPTNVFAVGRDGLIFHWDGAGWSAQTSGIGTGINGVWGAGPMDVWAVSIDTILHYDGTWTAQEVGGGHFGSIAGVDGDDIYAAADGNVWRYHGGTWTQIAAYPGSSVGAISGLAASGETIFGVSSSGQGVRGHMDGYVVLDPDTVAVGATTFPTVSAYTWEGTPVDHTPFSWSSLDPGIATVDPATGEVTGVACCTAAIVATAVGGAADTAEVFVQVPTTIAVTPGGGSIADAGMTTSFSATVYDQNANVIDGAVVDWRAYNEFIATIDAGGTATGADAGQTLIEASLMGAVGHAVLTVAVQGTTPVTLWSEMVSPGFGNQIWRVRTTGDDNEAWALGGNGALYFDGATWTNLLPGVPVYGGWVMDQNNVYVTGNAGRLYHWDGADWDTLIAPASTLYGVWGSSPTNIWVSGETPGEAYHYDGTGWSTVALPVTHSYTWDIWGTDSARVFMVGGAVGGVFEFDGTNWSVAAAPAANYRGLWGPGGDSVFAGGPNQPGIALRANGMWANASTAPLNAYGVWGSAVDDIYSVGSGGSVGRSGGGVWDTVQGFFPSGGLLWSVSGTADGDLFAVSSGGGIYRGIRGGSVSFTNLPDSVISGDTLRGSDLLTALDGSGGFVDSVFYNWTSSDPNVAYGALVGNRQVLVVLDTGTVQIIATAGGGAADTATLRVVPKAAAYVRSETGGPPWSEATNEAAMDSVFGVGNWDDLRFETVDPGALFNRYRMLYFDGSDAGADEMEAFIAANQASLETFVSGGGRALINSAPNEGDGMSMGFGVTLVYSSGGSNVEAVDPGHPIFEATDSTLFSGGGFAHAIVSGTGLDAIIVDVDFPGETILGELVHGSGLALFGGMTTDNFHFPQPWAHYLRVNIIAYAAGVSFLDPPGAPPAGVAAVSASPSAEGQGRSREGWPSAAGGSRNP